MNELGSTISSQLQLAQSFPSLLKVDSPFLSLITSSTSISLCSLLVFPLLCRSSSSYQRSTHSEHIVPSAMATTRHRNQLLLAVALALVLLVGSADAWQNCKKGYKTCKPDKHPGCETCIDNDPHNCGDCGIVCKYGECKYGKCTPPPKCPSGYGDCDGKRHNGCESNLHTDPYNCGKCGNKCKSGCKCQNGKCSEPPPQCKPGYGDCDGKKYNGCEKDLRHDIYNCGKCGHKCPCTLKWGEPTCNWGKCGQQCKHGWKYDNAKKCCVQGH